MRTSSKSFHNFYHRVMAYSKTCMCSEVHMRCKTHVMGVGGEKYIQEILVVTGRAQPLQIKSDNERLNATRQNYTYYYYYMKSVRGVIVSHCECDPYTY